MLGFISNYVDRPFYLTKSNHSGITYQFVLSGIFLFLYMSGVRPFPISLAMIFGLPLAFLLVTNIGCLSNNYRYLSSLIYLMAILRFFLYDFRFNYIVPLSIVIFATLYIFYYAGKKGEKYLQKITILIASFFFISFLVFISTLLFDSGIHFRDFLYSNLDVTKYEGEIGLDSIQFRQGGLAYFLFTFGYQIAGGTVLLLGLAMALKGKNKMFWAMASIIAVTTLFVAGQRSATVGVSVGIILMIPFSKVRRPALNLAVVLFLLIGSYMLISKTSSYRSTKNTSYGRLLSDNPANHDILPRLSAQLIGAKMIAMNPLGIRNTNISFANEVIMVTGFSIPSVHNGYIGPVLSMGWIFGIITFMVVIRILRMSKSTLKLPRTNINNMVERIIMASLISVMINALFHNPSIFSFSSESLVLLFLYTTWYDYNRKICKMENNGKSAQ